MYYFLFINIIFSYVYFFIFTSFLPQATEIRHRLEQRRREAEKRALQPRRLPQSDQNELREFLELRTSLGRATNLEEMVTNMILSIVT